ncbi:MAG: magnesium transporter [Deltaproteobacteria bacterium]|nr:magnesium transporter [Deltaproteobacteria bacterium]
MQGDRNKILLDSIKRLLRRNALYNLQKIVDKTHAADLSRVFDSLTLQDQKKLFQMIRETEQKGVLFSEMEEDTFLEFVEDLELEEFVSILESMPNDDVADIIGRLPEEKSDEILKLMQKEDSEKVEGLLRYGDDTAGGIMVPDFIALEEHNTAKEAIESLQKEHQDVEMPFYLYVVNDYGNLVGVISLRQLVVVPPQTPLKAFMTTDVFAVKTDMDQEEVARIVARYDILAVPVVDETNKLVGIVTVDDVIDIFRREATEDILKMAGVGEEYVETKSIFKSTRIRFPWLFASCVGGIIAFYVIDGFESSLKQLAYLAAFIPVVMGMGGNIGTQSSTIVVRGLATGRINVREIWSVVLKELAIGVILGLTYGMFIGIVAQLVFGTMALAVSVCCAILSSMAVAALVGSLVPMAFAKADIDPAVATGPFVTTSIDVISVSLYFSIATTLLGV